jgi:hypothetical protein
MSHVIWCETSVSGQLESIRISISGTRMNTDYQDIKSYKKPNICENLCPKLT